MSFSPLPHPYLAFKHLCIFTHKLHTTNSYTKAGISNISHEIPALLFVRFPKICYLCIVFPKAESPWGNSQVVVVHHVYHHADTPATLETPEVREASEAVKQITCPSCKTILQVKFQPQQETPQQEPIEAPTFYGPPKQPTADSGETQLAGAGGETLLGGGLSGALHPFD